MTSVRAQISTGIPDSDVEPEPVDTDWVYLLNADLIRFDSYINPDAQRLMGNVVFRHDSMYMYCDSALFYQDRNSFDAYHNVRAEHDITNQALCIGIEILIKTDYVSIKQIDPVGINLLGLGFNLQVRYRLNSLSCHCREAAQQEHLKQ